MAKVGTNMNSPAPVLPEYVQESAPPPSYEEVMGHQIQSSVKHDVPQGELPPLAYIDFMPRCVGEGNMKQKIPPVCDSFSIIVQAANQWLQTNPQYGIWKCETVERKVEQNGTFPLDQMVYHLSTYGFNVYIRGLRLWLFVKKEASSPQQIGLLNVVPEVRSVEIPMYVRAGPAMAFGTGMPIFMYMNDPYFMGRMGAMRIRYIETYDDLDKTIEKLNSDLEKLPIQGSVLNVESAVIKTKEGFGDGQKIDPDSTVWAEEGKNSKRYVHILRVFYIIGQPAYEKICLKEFVPDITKQPTVSTPAQFQTFDQCVNRLATWIPHQTGIRVVNIQTYEVRYSEFLDKLKIDSNSTDDFDSGMTDRKYLQTMRVFYVTSSKVQPPAPTGFLCARTFLPVRTGRRTFETMSQTMYRIEAWLKATGMPIFNVETIRYLVRESQPLGVDLNKSHYMCLKGTGLYYVTAIRVYFPCPYQEPHPDYLPRVIPYVPGNGGSETCAIL